MSSWRDVRLLALTSNQSDHTGEHPTEDTRAARSVDMFDCVMPTRNARKGSLFREKRSERTQSSEGGRLDMDIYRLSPLS